MNNLMPPANASPDEIQAWNNMMDTMVTFIKASTHLMNTITQKVKINSGGRGSSGSSYLGCEPECAACQPKPPCGVCKWGNSADPKAAKSTSKTVTGASAPASQVAVPPPTPEAPAEAENPEGEATDGEEGGGGTDGGQTDGGETDGDEKVKPEKSKESAAVPSKTAQPAGDINCECVCAAVRAKREKKKCSCPNSEKEDLDTAMIEEEEAVQEEQMCGCGLTDGNQAAMLQEMMEKLANAQQEITELQEEMARLQRMDTSRRTGPHATTNAAALYKEIMRDNKTYGPPANVRQRMYPPTNAVEPQPRYDRPMGGRNPDIARRRMFPSSTPACPPCDQNGSSGAFGLNSEISPMRSTAQQRAGPPGQRPMYLAPPQQNYGGRQAIPSRMPPPQQYGGYVPLCQKPNSGFQSLSAAYQDSPDDVDPGGWNQNDPYGAMYPGNMPNQEPQPMRRIVICKQAPPQNTNNCPSKTCNNRAA